MRNRTRVIAAAAAVTAALAAGSTATAMASTTGGVRPGTHEKPVSVSMRCTPDSDLAIRLGVSQARLDQALRAVMPEPGGLDVCRAIRARGDDIPILMLTARDLVSDRVAGLDAGADDYLAKPFALEELRARLRALLRRSGAGADVPAWRLLYLVAGTAARARIARTGPSALEHQVY